MNSRQGTRTNHSFLKKPSTVQLTKSQGECQGWGKAGPGCSPHRREPCSLQVCVPLRTVWGRRNKLWLKRARQHLLSPVLGDALPRGGRRGVPGGPPAPVVPVMGSADLWSFPPCVVQTVRPSRKNAAKRQISCPVHNGAPKPQCKSTRLFLSALSSL